MQDATNKTPPPIDQINAHLIALEPLLRKLVGSYGQIDFEDRLALARHAAWQAIESFDHAGTNTLTSWVSHLAHRAVLSELRRFYRHGRLVQHPSGPDALAMNPVQPPPELDAPSPMAAPDEETAQRDAARHLETLLHQLTPTERRVVRLSHYDEWILEDIARLMGLSVTRVHQIRTAAYARLRKLLQKNPL